MKKKTAMKIIKINMENTTKIIITTIENTGTKPIIIIKTAENLIILTKKMKMN
jgi:hypothetical protein